MSNPKYASHNSTDNKEIAPFYVKQRGKRKPKPIIAWEVNENQIGKKTFKDEKNWRHYWSRASTMMQNLTILSGRSEFESHIFRPKLLTCILIDIFSSKIKADES